MLEIFGHGGDLKTAAETFGRPEGSFLDFSSNMNPWGPPKAVEAIIRSQWRRMVHYPDPDVRVLRGRIAAKYGVPIESILVGNGAAELIDLIVRVLQPKVTGLAQPSFSEYEEAVNKSGGQALSLPLLERDGFELQWETVKAAREQCDLLFLGHPNNPTGRLIPQGVLSKLVESGKPLIVDEAFLDFVPNEEDYSLLRLAAEKEHLFVIRSMTKFYAMPGLRLGFLVAHPKHIRKIKALQVQWSVNFLAQEIGAAVLGDEAYADQTREWLREEKPWLTAQLEQIGLSVTPSDTNFLLVKLPDSCESLISVKHLQTLMGSQGILIRDASLFEGLNERFFRVAIKLRTENEQLIAGLAQALQVKTISSGNRDEVDLQQLEQVKQAPTIMLQGTASDVGKSMMTAAICRILLQDGLRVAPFKSQNMSLNSYVTPDGKEIGRAQGVQADACRIPATTDMNPILLKPKGNMVSQIVVHGKPYMDLDARTYRETYLPKAEPIVKEALSRLREKYDVVVIEGAGSPAEINLKDRDIVNMRLAQWADAPVILVADIDRGGVFASIVGTLELLEPHERDKVKGLIINKFRGDVTLLQSGIEWLEHRTGKPVLGVIPYLPHIGLEDEDSASLDAKRNAVEHLDTADSAEPGDSAAGGTMDIAVIRLPRISNFTDMDPLLEEKDVRLRYVSSLSEWGNPDLVIIPGSKNTMEDLVFLQKSGLAERIRAHASDQKRWLVGICAGYQMMGKRLLDPQHCESDIPEASGLGLLHTETTFTPDKRTVQVEGITTLYGNSTHTSYQLEGYEIHMGRTRFLHEAASPFQIRERTDAALASHSENPAPLHPDGLAANEGKVWGTYLHGILQNDDFRRALLNRIRAEKGWKPLPAELRYREKREAAFDRLAEHVRMHLDMNPIYEMIGLEQ